MGQMNMTGADIDMNMMKSATLREYFKVIEDKIKKTKFTLEEQKANKEKIEKIFTKLKAGKKLTSKDMAFLQSTDFDAYIHALRVQQTRKNLVSALKHAKSKAQANLIIARALGSIDDRDPDKEILIAAINDIGDKFKKSSAYQHLPETDRDARKKDRVNKFDDEAEEDDDEDEDSGDRISDDTGGSDVIAGEPTGTYQSDSSGGNIETIGVAETGLFLDFAG